jgi:hypothetical protein
MMGIFLSISGGLTVATGIHRLDQSKSGLDLDIFYFVSAALLGIAVRRAYSLFIRPD